MFRELWANAVVCGGYCEKLAINRGKQESSVMDKGGCPKKDADDFFEVLSGRLLLQVGNEASYLWTLEVW